VITDDGEVIAESGAIIEYLVEKHGAGRPGELAHLQPSPGTAEYRQCRYWMHYAEGSLMNWLVMKLVFTTIPRQPMPFFARPIARTICGSVQRKLVDPNLEQAKAFLEEHLGRHEWIAGPHLTMADFQMSFAIEALLARATGATPGPKLVGYRARIRARPAYQRAERKGGPVIMST
jgi:glutathione S-transferase